MGPKGGPTTPPGPEPQQATEGSPVATKYPSHQSDPSFQHTFSQSSPKPRGDGKYERKVVGGPITLPLPAPAYAVHSKCQPEGSLYFCKMHSWSGLCPAHGWLTGSSL